MNLLRRSTIGLIDSQRSFYRQVCKDLRICNSISGLLPVCYLQAIACMLYASSYRSSPRLPTCTCQTYIVGSPVGRCAGPHQAMGLGEPWIYRRLTIDILLSPIFYLFCPLVELEYVGTYSFQVAFLDLSIRNFSFPAYLYTTDIHHESQGHIPHLCHPWFFLSSYYNVSTLISTVYCFNTRMLLISCVRNLRHSIRRAVLKAAWSSSRAIAAPRQFASVIVRASKANVQPANAFPLSRYFSQTASAFTEAEDNTRLQSNSAVADERYRSDMETASQEGRALYIANISYDATTEHLMEAFGKYGEIETVNIAKDGRGLSRGCVVLCFWNFPLGRT
jgi:hypothetical protein